MTTNTSPLLQQDTINRLMAWQICGDTGLSSQCLAATIMSNGATVKLKHYYARQHPLDSADFNRCVQLLNQVPELRQFLPMMRDVSDYWAVLVDHWDELEKMLNKELKSRKKDNSLSGTTYKRMQELFDPLDEKRYKKTSIPGLKVRIANDR